LDEAPPAVEALKQKNADRFSAWRRLPFTGSSARDPRGRLAKR